MKTHCETDGSFFSTSVDVEEVAELDLREISPRPNVENDIIRIIISLL